MRGLVASKIYPMMSDSRLSHPSHRHHSHASQSYQGHGPALAYPTLPSHPSYNSHSNRQIHNGPLPSVSNSGHVQSLPMSGVPDGVGPSSVLAVGNGHAHGPPPLSGMSVTARAAKEKMDSVLSQLATANENTWMLIGTPLGSNINKSRFLTCLS